MTTTAPTLTEEDLAVLEEAEDTTAGERATDPVNDVFRKLGAVVAIAATAVVWALLVVGVLLRYVTGTSLDFATELPTYLFPWIIAGGVVVAMAVGGHVAVDFFVARLAPRRAAQVYGGVWVFGGLLFGLLTVLAVRLVGPLAAQTTPILGWPMIGSFAAFVLMSLCLTVQSFARAVHIARTGRYEHEEARGV